MKCFFENIIILGSVTFVDENKYFPITKIVCDVMSTDKDISVEQSKACFHTQKMEIISEHNLKKFQEQLN